nr:MAG: N-acetylmuramoyl-L-alanine amidase [Bacteriophage sp.]
MLRRMILDQSKQGCKFPYLMNPKGICIHNTDNSASALNERNNLNRPENNDEASFHVVTDENESIQCIEFNRNAWAAGDGGNGEGNRNYIHWEIARNFHSDPAVFAAAQERAAKDVAEELKSRGWGIDRIKTHRDFSGKNCPSRTDINKFKQKVQAYLNNGSVNIPSSNPEVNISIQVGDKVKATGSKYATGQEIPGWVKNNTYEVIQVSGNKVLLGDIMSWVYSSEVQKVSGATSTPTPGGTIVVGSKVKVTGSKYATGQEIPGWVKNNTYEVIQLNGNKILLGSIMSWVYTADVVLVSGGATSTPTPKPIGVGSKVKVTGSKYATGETVPGWVKSNTYEVIQVSSNKVLLGGIMSWVYTADVKAV